MFNFDAYKVSRYSKDCEVPFHTFAQSFRPSKQSLKPHSTPLTHIGELNGNGIRPPGLVSNLDLCSPYPPESPTVDDGYSSVSSLSNTMQAHREFDDHIFKSTPIRPSNSELTDSGFGCSSLLGGSLLELAGKIATPTGSFLGSTNSLSGRQASVDNLITKTNTPKLASTMSPSISRDFYDCDHVMSVFQGLGYQTIDAEPRIRADVSTHISYPTVLSHALGPNIFNFTNRNLEQDLYYREIIAKVREEMMQLINNSMKQLEFSLRHTASRQYHAERLGTLEIDVNPLNLKSHGRERTADNLNVTVSQSDGRQWIQTSSERVGLVQAGHTEPMPTRQHHPPQQAVDTPTKGVLHLTPHIKQITSKRRRLRIRTGGRRLRVRQTIGRQMTRRLREESSELERPIPSEMDGTLDLRIRNGPEAVQARQGPLASEFLVEPCLHKTKALNLSALHLKRAKLMFMYARYPSSSALKAFFTDVTFTRTTTAQLVKWFSNFREFFYIQIEKTARLYQGRGLKSLRELELTRDHEVFRNLEIHYNKDHDIETPEEFLHVIRVAVSEFTRAINDQLDRDPSWKKTIYKTLALLDTPFPNFIQYIR